MQQESNNSKRRQIFTWLVKLVLVMVFGLTLTLKLDLLNHSFWLGLLIFGLVLGGLFPELDERFFYSIYIKKAKLRGVLSRSLIFLVVFIPLTVFIITSSSSPLGLGFVLGFLVSSAVDLLTDLSLPQRFQARYLYQFAREFTSDEQRLIAFSFSGLALLVALLALL